MNHPIETYISVDVETAGPNPGQYSLLSIGACTWSEPRRSFYVELQPVNDKFTLESFAIHGLSLETLAGRGLPPAQAMAYFDEWLAQVVPPGNRPVFVAFNAPFDWMFVCDYFYRYLGRNPFGHSALDIKAYYMGLTGSSWGETAMQNISKRYALDQPLSHNALQDALDQADLFLRILAQAKNKQLGEINPPG